MVGDAARRREQKASGPLFASLASVQFDIISQYASATAEARVYAEFRLFATLARHARAIRMVQVVLGQINRRGATDRATCAVRVVLQPSGSACVRARGPHPRGAIDRAAERVGDLMHRRTRDTTRRHCHHVGQH